MFLSHDVDWRREGPEIEHIRARKDRFEKRIIDNLETKNPYYNTPEIMDLEDKFGVKSTFFYRTKYENGNFKNYENDIVSLLKGGWEIGLHSDPSSIDDIEKLRQEKKDLESLTKTSLKGNRVHYLGFNNDLPDKLSKLGFVYDSTIRHTKNRIDKNEMGHFKFGDLIEFPLTLMDAYLFTYMKIPEDKVVQTVKQTIDYGRKLNNEFNVITINWHDNVLQMTGGRMYKNILEFLSSQEDIKICRGIDIVKIISKQN